MGGIFSEKEKSRITDQDRAILGLKKQRDQLKQYQKRIEGVLGKDRDLARKLLKEGKKDRAKLLLRKKKYQEGLLDQTAGQLDNIERLCQDLEFTQVLTLWNPHLHPFIVRFKSKCWMDCKKGMMLWRKQTLFSALMKLSLL